MTREEIFDKLSKIFDDTFFCDATMTEESSMDDIPEWESMTHIVFLSTIQKEFGVEFDLADLNSFNKISKIIDFIFREKNK